MRLWCIKSRAIYTRRLKRNHRGYGDTFYVDEVYLHANRRCAPAKRLFKRLLRSHGGEPRKIVTDKQRRYGVAHRELILNAVHNTSQYANNRAEQSHEATRVREQVCVSLNQPSKLRNFWALMLRSAICSIWEGTRSALTSIGILG